MDEFFEALSHPIRRTILEELELEGSLTYTRLVELTDLKPGPLYHHLKMLNALIYQDEHKQYRLNDEGRNALAILRQRGTDRFDQTKQGESEPFEDEFRLLGLSLSPLLGYVSTHPYRTLVEFAIISLIFGFLAGESDILLVGTFVTSNPTNIIFAYVSILVSFVVLAGLIELVARFVLKRKEAGLELLSANTLIFSPIFLFFLIIWIIGFFSSSVLNVPLYILLIVHSFFQIWSFIVITTALIDIKGIKIERSAIIALAVNYIQIMIILFLLI